MKTYAAVLAFALCLLAVAAVGLRCVPQSNGSSTALAAATPTPEAVPEVCTLAAGNEVFPSVQLQASGPGALAWCLFNVKNNRWNYSSPNFNAHILCENPADRVPRVYVIGTSYNEEAQHFCSQLAGL